MGRRPSQTLCGGMVTPGFPNVTTLPNGITALLRQLLLKVLRGGQMRLEVRGDFHFQIL
jgi:hypothetical protein